MQHRRARAIHQCVILANAWVCGMAMAERAFVASALAGLVAVCLSYQAVTDPRLQN